MGRALLAVLPAFSIVWVCRCRCAYLSANRNRGCVERGNSYEKITGRVAGIEACGKSLLEDASFVLGKKYYRILWHSIVFFTGFIFEFKKVSFFMAFSLKLKASRPQLKVLYFINRPKKKKTG